MDISTIDWSALLTMIIGILIIAVPAAVLMAKKYGKEFATEISGALAHVAEASNDTSNALNLAVIAFDDDKITPEEIQTVKDKVVEAKNEMEEAMKHARAVADKIGK